MERDWERFESVCALIGMNQKEITLLGNYFSIDQLKDFTEYVIKEYDIDEEDI